MDQVGAGCSLLGWTGAQVPMRIESAPNPNKKSSTQTVETLFHLGGMDTRRDGFFFYQDLNKAYLMLSEWQDWIERSRPVTEPIIKATTTGTTE